MNGQLHSKILDALFSSSSKALKQYLLHKVATRKFIAKPRMLAFRSTPNCFESLLRKFVKTECSEFSPHFTSFSCQIVSCKFVVNNTKWRFPASFNGITSRNVHINVALRGLYYVAMVLIGYSAQPPSPIIPFIQGSASGRLEKWNFFFMTFQLSSSWK